MTQIMDALQPLNDILQQISSRLANVEAKLGLEGSSNASSSSSKPAAPAGQPVANQEVPKSVEAYDEMSNRLIPPFVSTCQKLGGVATELGALVKQAFEEQRNFLIMASQCKKPATPQERMNGLQDVQKCVKKAGEMRDNRSEFSNHLNTVYEGIQALGWLCVEPTPKPFIESFLDGSNFWANKIRVAHKKSNPDHVAFADTFKNILTGLMDYVKEYHTTGVVFNPKGGDMSSYSGGGSSSSSSSASSSSSSSSTSAKTPAPTKSEGGGINAVFAGIKSIDQSSGKTAGLRTVTKDMQTWRSEYKGNDEAPKPAAPKFKKREEEKPTGPPLCELKADKWMIENQGTGAPVTVDVSMKQQVFITKCIGATIVLNGKCKSIAIDGCKKTNVVFDSAVSAVEIVNGFKIQVQAKDNVPSISIDKTDGCAVYVSEKGKNVQVISSKSSEMNINFPDKQGEMIERPIPEQFEHSIVDGQVKSTVSSLYSH